MWRRTYFPAAACLLDAAKCGLGSHARTAVLSAHGHTRKPASKRLACVRHAGTHARITYPLPVDTYSRPLVESMNMLYGMSVFEFPTAASHSVLLMNVVIVPADG